MECYPGVVPSDQDLRPRFRTTILPKVFTITVGNHQIVVPIE